MEVSEHWWLEKENDAIHFVRVKDGVQSNKMKVIEIGSSPKDGHVKVSACMVIILVAFSPSFYPFFLFIQFLLLLSTGIIIPIIQICIGLYIYMYLREARPGIQYIRATNIRSDV